MDYQTARKRLQQGKPVYAEWYDGKQFHERVIDLVQTYSDGYYDITTQHGTWTLHGSRVAFVTKEAA